MIYQVHLAELIRKRLTDVVMLQLRLLRYAASTGMLDISSCANYVDRCARFRGRGSQIVTWLWKGSRNRRGLLEKFAQGPVAEKQEWSRRLFREALAFLRNPMGPITPYISKGAAPWQNAGADFLHSFYEALRDSGLPGYLFSEPGAAPFHRQNFLAGFQYMNQGLTICAICDELKWCTKTGDFILADIEHYLPKSLYPHLACHPFNLLPICHNCNLLKRNADPLKGRSNIRRSLENIFLPYREPGLGSKTYLHVRLGKSYASTELGPLRLRTATDLRQRIEAFGDVYRVPKRWQEQIDEIGEKLFRRIGQFLQAGGGIPQGRNMPQALLAALDLLFYFFSHEDQGKEPFAFAMVWWIAALINHEVEPATQNPSHDMPQISALLQEISTWPVGAGAWSRQATKAISERLAIARDLRSVVHG